jgi:insulysin
MKLVVLGREPLELLDEMVQRHFHTVRSAATPGSHRILYESQPSADGTVAYTRAQTGIQLDVIPVKDVKRLNLYFPVPPLEEQLYTKHARFIAHILGHEGPGSLRSELQKRGWLEALNAGPEFHVRNEFMIFNLGIELTQKGDLEYEAVLQNVFAYINQLHVADESTLSPRFLEFSRELDLRFRFLERKFPDSYVTGLADALALYPTRDVIRGQYATEWNFEELKWFIRSFIPENLIVMRISTALKELLNPGSAFSWRTEPWYGTQYSMRLLPSTRIQELATMEPLPWMRLPDLNPLMPEDFLLRSSLLTQDGTHPKYSLSSAGKTVLAAGTCELTSPFRTGPLMIADSPGLRVWHKLDASFGVPKAGLHLLISHPLFAQSPVNMARAVLMVETVEESFNEMGYLAKKAGLQYAFMPTLDGLQVHASGYSDGLLQLLKQLLHALREVPRIILAEAADLTTAERSKRLALEATYAERCVLVTYLRMIVDCSFL